MILIKNSHIRGVGYSLLIINVIVFLLTWLQPYIGIPAAILLLFAYYKMMKNINADQTTISISTKTLILLCAIMFAWTVFTGLGGAFPQKNDLHWRNAILHDLINYSWPVKYSDGSALTYYFAFWLVPAGIGKLVGLFAGTYAAWVTANIAYAIYNAIILSVIMLLLISYLKATSMKRMLLVAMVLIFFSGMDIVAIILEQLLNPSIAVSTHLEWWTKIQYSSDTTQLGWVYNQAVPAWLCISLLLHEKKLDNYAVLGLLLLPYGPIPFVGAFLIMILQAIKEFLNSLKQKKIVDFFKNVISIQNIIAIVVILPVYYLFYFANSATSDGGFRMNSLTVKIYFEFILVEFLIYAIAIMRSSYKKNFFMLSVMVLFIPPLFTIGYAQDFCMRASIPGLFIVMVYITDYLLNNISLCGKGIIKINGVAIFLIICLALGAATPLTEFRCSLVQMKDARINGTSYVADQFGTLGNPGMDKNNFVMKNAANQPFYRYIGK